MEICEIRISRYNLYCKLKLNDFKAEKLKRKKITNSSPKNNRELCKQKRGDCQGMVPWLFYQMVDLNAMRTFKTKQVFFKFIPDFDDGSRYKQML